MAGVRFAQNSASVSTSTSAKTIAQVTAPANTGLIVDEIDVSFDGTSSTGPKVLVEILRSMTSGTGTTNNPVKTNVCDDETLQCTGKDNFTVEPSGGTVIDQQLVHPQAGASFRRRYRVKGGETLSIRTTVSTAVNARSRIGGEE